MKVRNIVVTLGVSLGLTAGVIAGQRGQPAPAPSPLSDGEVTIKPPFANAPELIYDNAVPHGTIHRFTMKSADSKIYKGVARGQRGVPPPPVPPVVPYERPVAVYIP